MSLLKKVQKRSVERKFGGTHPILRMGLDRNVIDAYFTGLVFAAVADDEAIDEAERAKLEKIGLALNLSPEDVRGAVDEMLARDGDAKVAVAEEAAGALRGTDAIQLFLCEWTQIWMSHEYQADELNEFRRQLCEWMGCEYDHAFFAKFDSADLSNTAVLKTILCEEQATYLSTVWSLSGDMTAQRDKRPANSCVTSETIVPRSPRGYVIEAEKCSHCAACYCVCPADAIEGDMATAFRIVSSRCKHCGKCMEACDYQAIVEVPL